MTLRTKIEEGIRDKLLYIGEEIPTAVAEDKRPKFVLLGYPQEIIDSLINSLEEGKGQ